MCELMAVCFNKPVIARFSFQEFIKRGNANPDGWGLGFYPDDSPAVQVIKEPIIAPSSQMAAFLKGYDKIHSSLYISHVRFATSKVCYANTHPFSRVLNGNEYIFAHNGYLNPGYRTALPIGKWSPLGSTDSEYAFCHIMNTIEKNTEYWDLASFSLIEQTLQRINDFGHFNCLFSDGEHLFCYRDKDGYKGLSYTFRQAPFNNIRLADEDFEIDLNTLKPADEKGFVIATRPLTSGEEWMDMQPGKLQVFCKGESVFPKQAETSREILLLALRYMRSQPERVEVIRLCNNIGRHLWDIAPIIDDLRSQGYIKKDSRDTDGPYSPFSTYYTVRGKRNEIDVLLEDDKQSNVMILDDKISQKANTDDVTKVCLNCWVVFKPELEFCRLCCHSLTTIDTRMLDIIHQLNIKGYPTLFCCCGHPTNRFDSYLVINCPKKEFKNIPDGYTLDNNSDKTTLRSIPYNKVKNLKTKKAREAISIVELESYGKQNLDNLRHWVKSLQTR